MGLSLSWVWFVFEEEETGGFSREEEEEALVGFSREKEMGLVLFALVSSQQGGRVGESRGPSDHRDSRGPSTSDHRLGDGVRRSAVSGKKSLLKLDKSKEDKAAENKRNELLKFLNASFDWRRTILLKTKGMNY